MYMYIYIQVLISSQPQAFPRQVILPFDRQLLRSSCGGRNRRWYTLSRSKSGRGHLSHVRQWRGCNLSVMDRTYHEPCHWDLDNHESTSQHQLLLGIHQLCSKSTPTSRNFQPWLPPRSCLGTIHSHHASKSDALAYSQHDAQRRTPASGQSWSEKVPKTSRKAS